MNPIPTIHPSFIPSSLATVPSECRKPATFRIYQPDELDSFNSKYKLSSLADVIKYIKNSQEYSDLQTIVSENSVTSYRVVIYSGIATIRECIHIDSNLHVKLSNEGCPIPLPGFIRSAEGCKLTSLDIITNLPAYCKNSESPYEINVIK